MPSGFSSTDRFDPEALPDCAIPYAPPQARVETPEEEAGLNLARIASGQKLVIYGVLLYILSSIVMAVVIFGLLLVIPALILGLIGVLRIGAGFGWSVTARVLLLIHGYSSHRTHHSARIEP